MLSYLKVSILLIFYLFKNNPIKSAFLLAACIFFFFAGSFSSQKSIYKIVEPEKKIGTSYVYIYEYITNNKIEYRILNSDTKLTIENGIITQDSYNDWNIAFWVFFGCILIYLIIAFFMGFDDEEASWEFDDCYSEAFSSLIYCELEDDEYYYFAMGHLIKVRDEPVSTYYPAADSLEIKGFNSLFRCPKYETKTTRRERKLNKILT